MGKILPLVSALFLLSVLFTTVIRSVASDIADKRCVSNLKQMWNACMLYQQEYGGPVELGSITSVRQPVAAIVLLAIMVVGRLQIARRSAIGDHARETLECILANDGARFFGYCRPDERRLLKLTPAKTQEVFDRVIAPNLSGYKPKGPIEVTVISESQADAVVILENEKGDHCQFTTLIDLTPEGGRTDLIGAVMGSWVVKYHQSSDHRGSPGFFDATMARLEGIHKQKDLLIRLGIDGQASDQYPIELVSWERCKRRFENISKKLEERQAKARKLAERQ